MEPSPKPRMPGQNDPREAREKILQQPVLMAEVIKQAKEFIAY